MDARRRRYTQANLSGAQVRGTTYQAAWIRIDDPNPQFPMAGGVPTTTNNHAIRTSSSKAGTPAAQCSAGWRGSPGQGRHLLHGHPGRWNPGDDRLEHVGRVAVPPGFGRGTGQVWAYHPQRGVLEVVYQSASRDDLHLPDNVTASPAGR